MASKNPQIPATPYAWPHDASLAAETTALVVIDMQRDLCSPEGYLKQQGCDIAPLQRLTSPLQQMLEVCRVAGFPVYYTREGMFRDYQIPWFLAEVSSASYRPEHAMAARKVPHPEYQCCFGYWQ